MTRILLESADVVGTDMAGPGIRYLELARALSHRHEVTLTTPNDSGLSSERFRVVRRDGRHHLRGHDAVVSQALRPSLVKEAIHAGTLLVYDAYDPVAFEVLEWNRQEELDTQRRLFTHARAWQEFSFRAADAVICASETQRDLWLGVLLSLGRLTPDSYSNDPALHSLIEVVPFGVPAGLPRRTGAGFRARFGIPQETFVVLWGGGIWDWLDPFTAIEAIRRCAERRRDIALVFMSTGHPNPDAPRMAAGLRAQELASHLGLRDRFVFFNDTWVPYEQRVNHLLDADAGISLHKHNLESRFAYRTRVLDYMWAGLPTVCTAGDELAERIRSDDLGRVVPAGDAGTLAAALEEMADDRPDVAAMAQRVGEARSSFTWAASAARLAALLQVLPDRPSMTRARLAMLTARYYAGLSVKFGRSEGLLGAATIAGRFVMSEMRGDASRRPTSTPLAGVRPSGARMRGGNMR